jgi:hypothetical protein
MAIHLNEALRHAPQLHLVWVVLSACLLMCACHQAPRSAAPEGNWISLFNGRDLKDWTPKFAGHPAGENPLNTFQVKDGVLVVSYDNYENFDGRFGHLFHTARPYSHYWIRAEYRFVGEQVPGAPGWGWRNNGLMLHSQPPETMGLHQEQPISIEVRLLGGKRLGKRPTANLCEIETSATIKGERITEQCIESSSATYRGDQWVLVEAEVRGNQVVRHFVNGKQVLEYSDIKLNAPQPWSPGLNLSSGYIGIQAETHPTEFRRIEVLNLEG